ncbi:YqhA family protein [Methanococcus voltae]|uniref:Putative membrane protein YqhA n=1 Tax=Methanococcus voltae TaxID=2188 RepID=A0A8J7RFX5_METVO|nr:YqhA family protein [Methanococcus voltae]MBP2171933.1 putative membrane protein YqhA [Methanococcus voltae]MBP2201112.1 putative membrane protein YqhA [Methanococcus voltae]
MVRLFRVGMENKDLKEEYFKGNKYIKETKEDDRKIEKEDTQHIVVKEEVKELFTHLVEEDEHDRKMRERLGIKKPSEQSYIERNFESLLWNSRYIVILAVVFGTISAVSLFLAGSYEVIHIMMEVMSDNIITIEELHNGLLSGIIGSIDLYLIGLVLLIFSFGIYELFVSKIDVAWEDGKAKNILEVYSLEELKSKILKVIIMVLIVSLFQKVLVMEILTTFDVFLMAIAILVLSISAYYIHK